MGYEKPMVTIELSEYQELLSNAKSDGNYEKAFISFIKFVIEYRQKTNDFSSQPFNIASAQSNRHGHEFVLVDALSKIISDYKITIPAK